jgi:hypothetical protein
LEQAQSFSSSVRPLPNADLFNCLILTQLIQYLGLSDPSLCRANNWEPISKKHDSTGKELHWACVGHNNVTVAVPVGNLYAKKTK